MRPWIFWGFPSSWGIYRPALSSLGRFPLLATLYGRSEIKVSKSKGYVEGTSLNLLDVLPLKFSEMLRFIISVILVGSCYSMKHNDSWYTPIPKDDVQRCPQDSAVMEVLPGVGFDALNNREMGRVLAVNFSTCASSLDKKYVIPDFVSVNPVKQSQVHLFSEMIDHWQNYSSMTSKSINIDASAHFVFGSISGSYSSEHESIKKNMIEDKSITIRTQLRHTLYRVHSEPDSQLHSRAKGRLLDIASYIQRNDTYMKTYLSQLFVRDFGTHFTTNVDAGAIIAQTDQINSNFVETFNEDKSKITASASGSFLGMFKAGGSFTSTSDTKTTTEYMKNRRNSRIDTIGGPPFRANFTLNDWEDGLDNGLVPVDRAGDPIWFAVTRASLPELPEDTILLLADALQEAVRQYYLHNVHRGCTDQSAKNFDPMSNFDDGQCDPPTTNYTFGGVYQTCDGPEDFCSKNRQLNPKTRAYSCPTPYKPQLLYSFNGPRECVKHCHGWWIFESCDWSCSQGVVNAFWCYATGDIPQDSGYLFGGVYTATTANLITQDKKCPNMFYPLKIVEGFVCVSDDYELGYKYSYPFGGFMSCDYGNPLAVNTSSKFLKTKPNSLQSFFAEQKGGSPKHCPKGYSQHLMQISHGCEINYCVQKNAFSDAHMPILRRPPYVKKPVPISNDSMYLLTASQEVWKKISPMEWVPINVDLEMKVQARRSQTAAPPGANSGIGLGGTVALTMVGTIVAALMIWAAVVIANKYGGRRPYRLRDEAPTVTYTGERGAPSLLPETPGSTETSRLVV